MYLTNDWYYFTSAIDKKTCNKIKSSAKGNFKKGHVDRKEGTTEEERKTGRVKDVGLNTKFRESDISWTSEQWIMDLIWPYMQEANKKAGWGFDIKSVEGMQITKYKPGGFYAWHKDGGADCLSTYNTPDNKFLNGNGRKLSMTILLNDNYDGGEFQFCFYKQQNYNIATPDFKNYGSIIIFPSFLEHRVIPVTKGIRYSLVAWFIGPPFK